MLIRFSYKMPLIQRNRFSFWLINFSASRLLKRGTLFFSWTVQIFQKLFIRLHINFPGRYTFSIIFLRKWECCSISQLYCQQNRQRHINLATAINVVSIGTICSEFRLFERYIQLMIAEIHSCVGGTDFLYWKRRILVPYTKFMGDNES